MTKREEAEQAMRLGFWRMPEEARVTLLREAINEALEEAASRCQMYDDATNDTTRLYGDAFADAIRTLKKET